MPFQHKSFAPVGVGGVTGQTVDVHRGPVPVVDAEGEFVQSLAPMDSAPGVGEGCPQGLEGLVAREPGRVALEEVGETTVSD